MRRVGRTRSGMQGTVRPSYGMGLWIDNGGSVVGSRSSDQAIIERFTQARETLSKSERSTSAAKAAMTSRP